MAKALREIEGMWEEIAARGAEFAGQKVRLILLTEDEQPQQDEWERLLDSVGSPAGVSLSNEATSSDNIYE